MAKYIIEIEDEPKNGLYKSKQFRTLVFDEEGLSRLEKYEEPEQAKPKRWRTVERGIYYYIDEYGEVRNTADCRCASDDWRYKSGNYCQTEEECEELKQSKIVYNELKAYAEPDGAVRNADTAHWEIGYSHEDERIVTTERHCLNYQRLHFTSKEAALAAIEAVGAERVKKFYLRIRGAECTDC